MSDELVRGPACGEPIGSDHAECEPDKCFTAKLRYWRKHGVPTVIPPNFKAV